MNPKRNLCIRRLLASSHNLKEAQSLETPPQILLQSCLTDWPSLPLNLWTQAWCLWCQPSKHEALHAATDTRTLLTLGADRSYHHSHRKDSVVSLAMGLTSDLHYGPDTSVLQVLRHVPMS